MLLRFSGGAGRYGSDYKFVDERHPTAGAASVCIALSLRVSGPGGCLDVLLLVIVFSSQC